MHDTLSGQRFERQALIHTKSLNADTRTVQLSFSSEEPAEQMFGREILDHRPESVRLDRLNNGAPVLRNHDHDQLLGVVESASIGLDKKGRVTIRFSQNPRGEEAFRDVQDGILQNASVGYRIHKVARQKSDDDVPTFKVTDWEPFEVSLVSIPADATVGVGRSLPPKKGQTTMQIDTNSNEEEWTDQQKERHRVNELLALGEMFKVEALARKAITEGVSLNRFRKQVLDHVTTEPSVSVCSSRESFLDSSEVQGYSLLKGIRALLTKDWHDAGFELDVSRQLGKQRGKSTDGLIIPLEVLTRTITKGGAGANLIGTQHRPDLFIDVLRSRSMLTRLGATVLPGLQGDVSIPRKTTSTTGGWVTEGNAVGESTPVPDAITLSPETVGGWTRFTRRMILQSSPGIERMMEQDLTDTLGTSLDVAGINGSGTSNQPLGILNLPGLTTVNIGVDGGFPTWDHIVALETNVGAANADIGALGYLTNANVRGKLKGTEKASGTAQFVWGDGPLVDGLSTMNGYRAAVSNDIPSNLTKGTGTNLSAVVYGNFADLLIGIWGAGVEILVDPYSESTNGNVRVIAMLDAAIGVRHVESFSAIVDAVTT